MTFLACHPTVTQIISGIKTLSSPQSLMMPETLTKPTKTLIFSFVRSHIRFCYHSWQRPDTGSVEAGNNLAAASWFLEMQTFGLSSLLLLLHKLLIWGERSGIRSEAPPRPRSHSRTFCARVFGSDAETSPASEGHISDWNISPLTPLILLLF